MRTEQRTRQVVQTYTVYIAKDGKEFDTEDKCKHHEMMLDGTRIVCPHCNGEKRFRGRFVEAYDNYDIGHVDAHYEWNTCPRCHGKGYLEKKTTWE